MQRVLVFRYNNSYKNCEVSKYHYFCKNQTSNIEFEELKRNNILNEVFMRYPGLCDSKKY